LLGELAVHPRRAATRKQYATDDAPRSIAEGAPDYWQPGLRDYVTEMWKRYVDELGADDATISIIVKSAEGGTLARLENLVRALRGSGRPMPTWFDIHPSWSVPAALDDLRRVDAFLNEEDLSQPIAIAEEAYDNHAVAEAIATFVRTSPRPVLEVMEWPLEHGGATFARCPTAPYRIAAYARALTVTRPFTLRAQATRVLARLTSAGVRVTRSARERIPSSSMTRRGETAFRCRAASRAVQGRGSLAPSIGASGSCLGT
jgi:hypothetical protein